MTDLAALSIANVSATNSYERRRAAWSRELDQQYFFRAVFFRERSARPTDFIGRASDNPSANGSTLGWDTLRQEAFCAFHVRYGNLGGPDKAATSSFEA